MESGIPKIIIEQMHENNKTLLLPKKIRTISASKGIFTRLNAIPSGKINEINLFRKNKKSVESEMESIKEAIKENKEKIEKRKKENSKLLKIIDNLEENIKKEEKEANENKKEISKEKEEIENLQKEIKNLENKISEKKQQKIRRQRENVIAERRRIFPRSIIENYIFNILANNNDEDSEVENENNSQYPNIDNMTYEEILALEEKMGSVSKGLDPNIIKKIPTKKFKAKLYDDDKCIICQYEFKELEKVKILPCMHIFHQECIENWLKLQKICPFCKSEINL